ncbi:hypothetical protein PAXRUDRAFT_197561 [Paxillus rubicundulus Ve08.2h10]|uniref:Uncharacterized protein n=1 Tax=Paxillus rubicundulus Ve08.2h10 TaxID=930991 RepID=A0A0D0CES6_9AGAM|nr:hypothetical protein PAXRUDRAFT_197561 [Paxillus rubicundulus Ve08.2h10]
MDTMDPCMYVCIVNSLDRRDVFITMFFAASRVCDSFRALPPILLRKLQDDGWTTAWSTHHPVILFMTIIPLYYMLQDHGWTTAVDMLPRPCSSPRQHAPAVVHAWSCHPIY